MSDWDQYVDQILHKLDYDKNEWIVQNICSAAAIYGHDGTCWAYSEKFPELKTYQHDIEDMAGNVVPCTVNEVEIAKKVGDGQRNPCDAGIRLGNAKYMFRAFDETLGGTQLSKMGGDGGAIANSKTATIIAFVSKDGNRSDKKFQ